MAEETKQEEINELEIFKQSVDFFKHLTTLDTGSILLLAAFLEKLFSNPHWKILVAVSFFGFRAYPKTSECVMRTCMFCFGGTKQWLANAL
jgi:hypothetical protein